MQDPKNRQKIAIWAPSHNFVRLYLRNQGRYWQSEKLVKQQCLFHMSPQYGELRPISGWDLLASLGMESCIICRSPWFGAPQQISTGFASWQRYCTAL